MVAIPIGYDQPGVAARIAYHGLGELVEVKDLTAERLAELLQTVLINPSYRQKARYFQRVIARTRGLDLAAETVERALGLKPAAQPAEKQMAVSHA
jgi:UDP:flavonoid glycosyltransferase YjiC (YdhE family)